MRGCRRARRLDPRREDLRRRLNRNWRRIRIAHGVTLEQIAERTGQSLRTVRRYDRGGIPGSVTLRWVDVHAQALGTTIDELARRRP